MDRMLNGMGFMGVLSGTDDFGISAVFAPALTAPMADEEENAARWRRVVLTLSDSFSQAAACQPRLAPYLLEALGNALEQLLLFGRERDLLILDEWLSQEQSPQPCRLTH